jgi:glycine/D-amino acid oxidase-like deaminating enzyme
MGLYCAMRVSARSWWLDEAGGVAEPAPALDGDVRCDVAIVGGGYTGMWTAWHVTQLAPVAKVVLLEGDLCGHGPSGRNGGFVEDLWMNLPALRTRFGDESALRIGQAAAASVREIGRWCEAEGVDAWFRRGGQLVVSAAPAQDGAGDDAVEAANALGVPGEVQALTPQEVQARCASSVFRGGVLMPSGATVQPARLALGLRARLLARGVTIHEHTRVRRVDDRGTSVEVLTDRGRVRAGHAVLAAGGALAAFPPLRGRLTVASSHIVLTEPVPDVLEWLGWTGGEAITDARSLLHYVRTTADGRIAFGWAGGRVAAGARLGGRIEADARVAAQVRADLVRMFPALAGRTITHAWGGPIDISPSHLPVIGSTSDRVHHAFGYTGNGVGPTQLAGKVLARKALDRRDELTALALVDAPADRPVPPEPLRIAGGALVLGALRRKEAAEERGATPDPVTRFVAGLPKRLGMTVGRGEG